MKISYKALSLISLFALIIIVISTTVQFITFNQDAYVRFYKNNNIDEITGKSIDELSVIISNLISVMKSESKRDVISDDFSEKEVIHMLDIRDIYRNIKIIKYISIIAFIGINFIFLLYDKKELYLKFINKGILMFYILLFILSVLAYIDFNKYFILFHEIVFTNDYWILDPNKDLLIQIFPEDFFIKRFVLIVVISTVIFFIIYLVNNIIIKKLGRKKIYNLDFTKL